jgi:pyridoxal biosynthesis lyase PdxS
MRKRAKATPRRKTQAEILQALDAATNTLWAFAAQLESGADRVFRAASVFERSEPRREAQAVINALLPDVRRLRLLVESDYAEGDSHADLRRIVRAVTDRLGEV